MPPGGGTRRQLANNKALVVVNIEAERTCGGLELVAVKGHGAVGVDMRQLFLFVQNVVCAFSSIAGQDSVGAPVVPSGGR